MIFGFAIRMGDSWAGARMKSKERVKPKSPFSVKMTGDGLLFSRRNKMVDKMMVLIPGILIFGIIGCSIKTPEIRGIVLDEETRQPVEGAWISGTIGVKTKTVGGDVGQVISLDPPHTRTGGNGRFVIPPKKLKKPIFPVGFGSEIDSLGIGARTADDKGGGITLHGANLKEFLGKDMVEIKIEIKPVERTEGEYFSHLQSLYNYCRTGRFGIEIPSVEGGCDEWELNYAIIKHERFIKRLGEPKGMDQRIHYVGAVKQLAYLYKQKGEFQKALDTFLEIRDFDKKRNMDLFLKEYDYQINELQKLIHEKKNRGMCHA
jgi:hypothetical protein